MGLDNYNRLIAITPPQNIDTIPPYINLQRTTELIIVRTAMAFSCET